MIDNNEEKQQEINYKTNVTASDPAAIYALYLQFYNDKKKEGATPPKDYDNKKLALPNGDNENPIRLSFNSPEDATEFMKLAAEKGIKFRLKDEHGNVLAHSNGDGKLYKGAAPKNGEPGIPFGPNEIISAPSNSSTKAGTQFSGLNDSTNTDHSSPRP